MAGKVTGQELAPNFQFPNGTVKTQNTTLEDGGGNFVLINGAKISAVGGASLFTGANGNSWGVKAGTSVSAAFVAENSVGTQLFVVGGGTSNNNVTTLNNILEDGNGGIIASEKVLSAWMGAQSGSPVGSVGNSGSGVYLGWNYTNNQGEGDIFVYGQSGAGGLNVYNTNTAANGVFTKTFAIDSVGKLATVRSTATSGRYGVPIPVASTSGEAIFQTVGNATFVTYTPPQLGAYLVYLFLRVVTASTTITATVTYYDGGGVQQTATILNNVSQAVGTYSAIPVYIVAGTGGPINVNVNPGTANQVYASATIMAI